MRALVICVFIILSGASYAETSCGNNPICLENARTDGVTDRASWDIYPGYEDYALSGFAAPLSIDRVSGNRLLLKIKSPSQPYTVYIYRLGWYGGHGARLITVLNNGVAFPAAYQPPCNYDGTGHATVDCSNWSGVPYQHDPAVPSGIFVARVITYGGGRGRLIPFIVRDDSRQSDVLVQTPDLTWQAYNMWTDDAAHSQIVVNGSIGAFYEPGAEGGVVWSASYNRPFTGNAVLNYYGAPYDTSYGFNPSARPISFFWDTNVTVVRYLERYGVNVSYITGQKMAQDYTATAGNPGASLLLPATSGRPRLFLTMGHDEYWSQEQRNNVARARAAGVNLMFLSGNEMSWKVSWDSPDFVHCEKQSNKPPHVGAIQTRFTGLWADPRYAFSPSSADARGPENGTTGLRVGGEGAYSDIAISPAQGALRFWRNTAFANGGTFGLSDADLPAFQAIGHEWDTDATNESRPSGIVHLSANALVGAAITIGNGAGDNARLSEAMTHNMIFFRDPSSRAEIFHAGSLGIGRNLDAFRSDASTAGVVENASMKALQRAFINWFADIGLSRPASLPDDSWWTPSTGSPPVPTIAIKGRSASSSMTQIVQISGTATGGGSANVGAVEVKITDPANPGLAAFWEPAIGTGQWTFEWTPPYPGSFNVQARAVNDFGMATDSAPVKITVDNAAGLLAADYHYSLFQVAGSTQPLYMGTEFRTGAPGKLTAIRIYSAGKAATVSVIDQSNSILASVNVPAGAAGWRTVALSSPLTLLPGNSYVAAYSGNYGDGFVFSAGYFSPSNVTAGNALPLTAIGGRYSYNGFLDLQPSNNFYGVDVVFQPDRYYRADVTYGLYGSGLSPIFSAAQPEVEIATQFAPLSDGFVEGIRVYLDAADTGPHTLSLWKITGTGLPALIAGTRVTGTGTSGWVTAALPKPIRVFSGAAYVTSLRSENGFAYNTLAPTPQSSGYPLSYGGSFYQYCSRDTNDFCTASGSGASSYQANWNVSPGSTIHYLIEPSFRPTAPVRQSMWPRNGVNPMRANLFQPNIWIGEQLSSTTPGVIEAVQFFNVAPGSVSVYVHDAAGTPICQALNQQPSTDGSGWNTVYFGSPCFVAPNTVYTVSYRPSSQTFAWNGYYFRASGDGVAPATAPPELSTLKCWAGVYSTDGTVPRNTYLQSNYYIDVLFRSHP